MGARISIPTEETLTGPVAQIAQNFRRLGGDTSTIRTLSYRSDLVPDFMRFYLTLRRDGRVEGRLKELARLRIAQLNRCVY